MVLEKVIRGEWVNLRDQRPDDFDDYQRWLSPGQEWQKWDAPWEQLTPLDDAERELWSQRAVERLNRPRTRLEIDTAEGRHIGWVNSYWVDEASRWGDCGIVIAEPDEWGKGFGREAFSLWVDYMLDAFDLPRIGMGTWSGNQRMVRVAARVGMREEARFEGARSVDGQRYDAVRWGVTRAEWKRYKAPRRDGLRRYTPADWEATVALTRQLFGFHRSLQGAPPFSHENAKETVYDWLARRDTVLWIWQEAGEAVGLARARYDGVFFLEEYVVAEGHRRQGIGARFLAALEDELRSAGEQDVFLSMVWPGNPGAINFFVSRGYDVLNTFELRKGLHRDRRGREILFLGRPLFLGGSVPASGVR